MCNFIWQPKVMFVLCEFKFIEIRIVKTFAVCFVTSLASSPCSGMFAVFI